MKHTKRIAWSGVLVLGALILHPTHLYAAPSCPPLTPTVSLFPGSPQYGGYPIGSGYSVSSACTTSGGAVTYLWTQTLGVSTLVLTGATTATVAATGNTHFGTDHLDLAATDMNGTTHVGIDLGTVIVDANGIVDVAAELGATVGAKMAKLTRLIIRVGANSLPWADDRHKAAIDFAYANYGADPSFAYGPYWQTYEATTVTLLGDSAFLAASSTAANLKTRICGGSGTPTGGGGWHMNVKYTGSDGKTHIYSRSVSACITESIVVLEAKYPLFFAKWGAMINCDAGCAGLQWSVAYDSNPTTDPPSRWLSGAAPANYYDIVVAGYTYWLRSGLTSYRDIARVWAHDWLEYGCVDYGYGFEIFSSNFQCNLNPRSVSAMGMTMYALDMTNEGDNSIWPGLRTIWNKYRYTLNTLIPGNGRIDDVREDAYDLAVVAGCAIAEIDVTEAGLCKTAVAGVASVFDSYKRTKGSSNYFESWYTGVGNIGGETVGGTGKITVTNMSVTGTISGGGPCIAGDWQSFMWMWTTAPNTRPASNASGDGTYYPFTANCGTGVVTFSKPYEGTSGDKGYVMGEIVAGWAAQSFMQGLMGTAMYLAQTAVSGYSGNTARDLYRSMIVGLGNWEMTYGYNPDNTGFYSVVKDDCGFPIPVMDQQCATYFSDGSGTLTSVSDRRTLSAEAMAPVALAYSLTRQAAHKTFANLAYGQIYGKPGTGGFVSDANYLSGWNDGGFFISFAGGGAYASITGHKWLGQFFGFPESSSTTTALLIDPVPTLSTISPTVGNLGTSSTITLTGDGFIGGGTTLNTSGSGVTFTSISVINATTLTATMNPGTLVAGLGSHTVTVTTSAGTSGAQTFTVGGALQTSGRNPSGIRVNRMPQ